MSIEKYPSVDPDDYDSREDYLEAVCEWWALEGKRWGEKIKQLEEDLEWKRGESQRETHRHLESVLGVGYETINELKKERDEARSALERLQGKTGQMMGISTTTARMFEWVTQQRDEAKMWAKEFKRIAIAMWCGDWSSDDYDKLFGEWPTLPEWLKNE